MAMRVVRFMCNFACRYGYDSVGGSGCCFEFFLLSSGGKILLVSGILSFGQAYNNSTVAATTNGTNTFAWCLNMRPPHVQMCCDIDISRCD